MLGLARQGKALARYLSEQGAEVTVSDIQPADYFAAAFSELEDLPIHYVMGEHPLSLVDDIDLLCLSGGVPTDLPVVERAQEISVPISNDAQIFLEVCPALVIGITGSAGKTTTTSLTHHIIQDALANTERKAWLGGNIGRPLIQDLQQIQPDDIVVMELSSFQLEVMSRSPQVAALLNLMPDHLDRHKTFEAYVSAKTRILDGQRPEDVAVLNMDDPRVRELTTRVRGQIVEFSRDESRVNNGTFEREGAVWLRSDGRETRICSLTAFQLIGRHNLQNLLASIALTWAAGVPLDHAEQSVSEFSGVPHRMEFVREVNGVRWYNDSIATTPDRAIAAIEAFDRPIILLAGGRDKDLDWKRFVYVGLQAVRDLILFGEAADKIERTVLAESSEEGQINLFRCSGLKEAVEKAFSLAQEGDIVLLSPGATSFDEFPNYEARGDRFKEWISEL